MSRRFCETWEGPPRNKGLDRDLGHPADQTIELTKDFQKDCSQVRVTTLQDKADYTVTLNHIEHGFVRDNQFLLSNKDGDVLYTKEGGSIDKNVKYACGAIQKDWKPKQEEAGAPTPPSESK
jgi:hypothetical protein